MNAKSVSEFASAACKYELYFLSLCYATKLNIIIYYYYLFIYLCIIIIQFRIDG